MQKDCEETTLMEDCLHIQTIQQTFEETLKKMMRFTMKRGIGGEGKKGEKSLICTGSLLPQGEDMRRGDTDTTQ
jgi:hypothetical protein